MRSVATSEPLQRGDDDRAVEDPAVLLELLGPVRVTRQGRQLGLVGRQLAVLAVLAARAPHIVSADDLAAAVWGEDVDRSLVRNRLQVALSQVRREIGAEAIRTVPPGYRLDVHAVATDTARFEQLVASATERPTEAARLLSEALRLLRGVPLADVEAPGLDDLRLHLDERVLLAREALAAALLDADRPGEAEAVVAVVVAAQPFRERSAGQLALALYRSGRQADALEVLRRLRERLADALGVDPTPAIAQLETAILQQDPSLGPAGALITAPSAPVPARARPPLPLAGLAGRRTDLRAVLERLDAPDVRLVTVVGPGGAGKTRLAQEVALERPGMLWVGLEAVGDADAVLPAIVTALELPASAAVPHADDLGRALQRRTVGLDNLEQVVDSAPMLAALLQHVDGLTLLVTSRVALRLPGEVVHHLGGLRLGAGGGDAGDLFIERAIAAGADRTRLDDHREAIADLVERVDGLPLAIELLAARARSTTPASLLKDVARWSAAESRGRGRPDRHRSVRAAIEWSWNLLSTSAQDALARLSVLIGIFTVDEAADALRMDRMTLSDHVEELVDASLVRPDDDGGLRLLVSVRAHAAERLERSGLTISVVRQVAEWVTDRFEDIDRREASGETVSPVDQSMPLANIPTALEYWEQTGQSIRLKSLLVHARRTWRDRTAGIEAAEWFARAGRLEPAPPEIEVPFLLTSVLAWRGIRSAEDRDGLLTRVAALCGSDPSAPWARVGAARLDLERAKVRMDVGDLAVARALAERALPEVRAAGDRLDEVRALNYLVDISEYEGEPEAGVRWAREQVACVDRYGLLAFRPNAYANLGFALVETGAVEEAAEVSHEAAAVAARTGDERMRIWAGVVLTLVALRRADAEGAERHIADGRRALDVVEDAELAYLLERAAAGLDALRGDRAGAERRIRGSDALLDGARVRTPLSRTVRALLGDAAG